MLESHYSPEKLTEQNFQKQLEGDEENEVDKHESQSTHPPMRTSITPLRRLSMEISS
jgi:hypothetical protein